MPSFETQLFVCTLDQFICSKKGQLVPSSDPGQDLVEGPTPGLDFLRVVGLGPGDQRGLGRLGARTLRPPPTAAENFPSH